MKWPRTLAALALATVLSVAIGCSSSDTPLGPSAPQGQQPSAALVSALSNLHLLSCSAQPYAVASKVIGPEGGNLSIGSHRLEIPQGALTSRVTIKGEQVSGTVNSVRLSPEGLRFAKPVKLVLSYRNCSLLAAPKRIAYTDELLRILGLPLSRDYPDYKYVSGWISHFSRYAVAW